MYSISNAASRAATPLQIGGSDHLVLLTSKLFFFNISNSKSECVAQTAMFFDHDGC